MVYLQKLLYENGNFFLYLSDKKININLKFIENER